MAALLAGVLFGIGLSVAGMVDPHKVLGFLDVRGDWDPSLLLVMAGAIAVYAPGWRWITRRPRPWLDARLHKPDARAIDARLLGGAALFGIGWGIAGYCPGPALASLSGAAPSLLVLVATMLAGWWLAAKIPAARA
jgi:uncharacterized membrane protein YedE/YeeE